MKWQNSDETMSVLRRLALGYPEVEEGLACRGTAIESAAFKVNGKTFLFLRPGKVMVKLDKSQVAASKLAARKPGCYKIGSGGWATVNLSNPKEVSMKILKDWIGESYGGFATVKARGKARSK